ncbi:MAG: hypothetical protein IEMM0002_0824 [bacterium]|nr:MAG: hypothetical protein IEMM0002_0824 [bacterium]
MEKDILKDNNASMEAFNIPEVVHTHRSGIFKFHAGIDIKTLQPMIDRIEDAHHRFSSIPILPEWANMLEKEIVVSGVFGTNTIEGGTLTEEETAAVLESPEQAKAETERRVVNLRNAYNLAEDCAKIMIDKYRNGQAGGPLVINDEVGVRLFIVEEMFTDLHKDITMNLTHPNNVPGQYRNNPKTETTRVGDTDHGGVYMPPKCFDDIKMLMETFVDWVNGEHVIKLSPLIRAPLVHYYFERIHPFWDGNGRVGRVVEAMILMAAGYKYAPFALSRYYFDNLDEYFSVFNFARKAEKQDQYPNNVFVQLFLKGMLEVMNKQHDRIRELVAVLVQNSYLHNCLEKKIINKRQYVILKSLPKFKETNLKDLEATAWYQSLYDNLTDKTRLRDFKRLINKKFIAISKDKKIRMIMPSLS